MNAKETMEALLAGKTVRPKNCALVMRLNPEGNLIQKLDGRVRFVPDSTKINCGCEVEEPKSIPEDILKALADGRRIRSGDMVYWLDGGLLRRQGKDEDTYTTLIDLSGCTVEKEDRRCRWVSYATDAAGWSPASRSPRCSSCLYL